MIKEKARELNKTKKQEKQPVNSGLKIPRQRPKVNFKHGRVETKDEMKR